MRRTLALAALFALLAGAGFAQEKRPLSPSGSAAAQVLGHWVKSDKPTGVAYLEEYWRWVGCAA